MRRIRVLIVVLGLLLLVTASVSHAQGYQPMSAQFEINIMEYLNNFLVALFDSIVSSIQSVWDWFADILDQMTFGFFSFFTDVITRIDQGSQMLSGIFTSIIQFTRPIFKFISFIISNLIEVVEILGIVLGLLVALAGIVLGWLVQIGEIVLAIFAGILGAPPVDIPGLPRCVTAPLESDICAVWYMFEYTVFADGTYGEGIIPLVLLGIDLIIIFYIVRSVIRIGRLFEGLTNVG